MLPCTHPVTIQPCHLWARGCHGPSSTNILIMVYYSRVTSNVYISVCMHYIPYACPLSEANCAASGSELLSQSSTSHVAFVQLPLHVRVSIYCARNMAGHVQAIETSQHLLLKSAASYYVCPSMTVLRISNGHPDSSIPHILV
jgi:hypothetical protein